MTRRLLSSRRGASMLEALLALTILALILAEIGQTQRSVRIALEHHRRLADPEAQLLAALAMFEHDCANLVDPGFRKGPDDPAIELVNGLGGVGAGQLTMYVAEQTGPPAARDLRRVTYHLADHALVRVSEPALASGAHAFQREEPLVDNMDGLQVRLYDGHTWLLEWLNAAKMPKGASIEIRLQGQSARVWRYLFGGAGPPLNLPDSRFGPTHRY